MANDLERSQNSSLERQSQERQLRRTGSLRDLMAVRSQKRTALLLDVSGSMSTHCADGKRRIEKLRESISELPLIPTITFGGYEYGAKYYDDQSLVDLTPAGGTPMGQAFTEAKSRDFKRVVVVTDGQPDSRESAMTASQDLTVDVIYVADPPMPQFLIDLTSQTGGSYQNIKIDQFDGSKQLTNAIKGLLEARR